MTVNEWQFINRFFSNKLSKQLIYNHIYPYTIECQPEHFLKDAKNFFYEFKDVYRIYTEIYTAHHLWKDLYNFLKQGSPPNRFFPNGNSHRYRGAGFEETVYRRKILLKHADNEKVCNASNVFIRAGPSFFNCYPDSEELMMLCRCLFALFNAEERRDFLENWVKRHYPPRDEYIQRWEWISFENDPYEYVNYNLYGTSNIPMRMNSWPNRIG